MCWPFVIHQDMRLKNDVARLFCKMYRSAFPTEFVHEIAPLIIIHSYLLAITNHRYKWAYKFNSLLEYYFKISRSDFSYLLWPLRCFLNFQHLIASSSDFPLLSSKKSRIYVLYSNCLSIFVLPFFFSSRIV